LFQIPELRGSSFLIISGQRTVGLVSLQKKLEPLVLVFFKKPQRIGGFHERMNNELVILWPVI
jgi:hypothetical protein